MDHLTTTLAALLAGISKDLRPEMAEHYNRLDAFKDALIAQIPDFDFIFTDDLLDAWNKAIEEPTPATSDQ